MKNKILWTLVGLMGLFAMYVAFMDTVSTLYWLASLP